jgi:hypothetical protein
METAENGPGDDAVPCWKLRDRRSHHRQRCRFWNPRTEARVRATLIVMRHPLGEDLPQMPLTERNEMVKTFATRGSDQALAERVRLRHARRRVGCGNSTCVK